MWVLEVRYFERLEGKTCGGLVRFFSLSRMEKVLIFYSALVTFFDILSTLLVIDRYGLYGEVREQNPVFWFFLGVFGSHYMAFFLGGIIEFVCLSLLSLASRLVVQAWSLPFYKLYRLFFVILTPLVIANNLSLWYFEIHPILFLLIINLLAIVVSMTVSGMAIGSLLILSDREKKDTSHLKSLEKYRKRRKEDLFMYCGGMGTIIIVLVYVFVQVEIELLIMGVFGILMMLTLIIDSTRRFKYHLERDYERAKMRMKYDT